MSDNPCFRCRVSFLIVLCRLKNMTESKIRKEALAEEIVTISFTKKRSKQNSGRDKSRRN